jgi:TPR repeat protein
MPHFLITSAVNMKIISITALLLIMSHDSPANTDEKACLEFVQLGENYKVAHQDERCLNAANSGSGSALYSVGMGHGFAGNRELEIRYYELAADKNNPAAYLALGHVYRKQNPEKALFWYERFAATKVEGYGYAALILARLYAAKDQEEASKYWLQICKKSPYKSNCQLN